ncbi:MAG: amidase [Proteobacteria bacterium]|nr:amidase [Pseudomonadota bacterium]
MIRLPKVRSSDYCSIADKISNLRYCEEIVQYYEDFIEQYKLLDNKYSFSESVDFDFIFEQLEENLKIRDRELFGIPFGIKDVFNTKVLPTSMGSQIWEGFKAGNNARIVDEIVDRGGIVFSKTTTAEFAVHFIQNNKTINPHNASRITGTSSAGSAVAVACGALPICLGTQTAGSIIRPASFCGVFGFKPSFGAFDRTGCLKTADTLDTIGFLGSDISGLQSAFLSTFQQDLSYPLAQNFFLEQRKKSEKGLLKIGVISDQFKGYQDFDSHVKNDFSKAVDLLQTKGSDVSLMKNVEFINDIHEMHYAIYCKSLSYYFQQEVKQGAAISKIMSEMISLGDQIPIEQYISAIKQQPEYRHQFDDVFRDYDFIVTPSTASVAPLIETQDEQTGRSVEKDDTCLIWTFLGYPTLSIPAFWSEKHQMPFGLQIIAPKYCDLPLLEFGEHIMKCLSDDVYDEYGTI